MNTMNMPGFTADSSVYRTGGHYRTTAGFAANGDVIRPQYDPDWWDCAERWDEYCSLSCEPLRHEYQLRKERVRCERLCIAKYCGPLPR